MEDAYENRQIGEYFSLISYGTISIKDTQSNFFAALWNIFAIFRQFCEIIADM